jgi:asparagine synthase (glutamine-hydrolysing)
MGAMLACLRHRGPDDEGLHAEPGVVLGHRRLSVIDVTGGISRFTAGAIHRSRRERRGLQLRGAGRRAGGEGSRFRTRSDSEVVAHAWDAWGPGSLDRFDGMFALAIWDGSRRRLVLARDRMGEKPLFYTVSDGPAHLRIRADGGAAAPRVSRHRPVALREYLALEYVPAPHCLVAASASSSRARR